MLKSLPGRDTGFIRIELEDADATVVAAVAAITSEAAATGVAHPQFGFLCGINIIAVIVIILVWGRLGEGAVIVYVVAGEGGRYFISLFGIKLRNIKKKKKKKNLLSTTDGNNTLLHKGIPEMCIQAWRCNALLPGAKYCVPLISIFW